MSQPAPVTIDEVLLALQHVRKNGDNWNAQCPAHDDQRASLSVSVGRNGGIVFKCFAGCSFNDIAAALHFTPAQLCAPKQQARQPFPQIVHTYDYRNLDGSLVYQVCRFEPKDFRQRRPSPGGGWLWNMTGVKRIPYRFNEVAGKETVYVTEGEKDVDNLWNIGVPATTNVGGAGKWRDAESIALAENGVKRVVLLPDNDAPGKEHMENVAKKCKAAGIAIMLLPLPDLPAKGDVSDWLKTHSRQELEALVATKLYVMPKGIAKPGDNAGLEPTDPHGAAAWSLSELGAAESFVHRYATKIRFDHQRERWLIWNCHHWRPDETMEIERLGGTHIREWRKEAIDIRDQALAEDIGSFVRSFEARGRFMNMLKFAVSRPEVVSDGTEWDRDPWLLGCPNGVVDLRTGQLRPGQHSDHVTLQVAPEFDANATCPQWERFIADVLDNDQDVIGYVQRALGYSLTGRTDQQEFYLCTGTGSNGKSTFLQTIEHVWNRYAYTTSMATFTISPRGAESDFNLAELDGPRVIMASETKTDSRFNEQLLKNFTGGERINAQRKHGHPFVYNPVGKIWIGVNNKPTVKDDSIGFWRRMRVINFPRTFQGTAANLALGDRLREEAPGILMWAIRGCLDFQQAGMQTPHSVREAVEDYKDSEDALRDFIAECLITLDPTAEESFPSIYEAYVAYQQRQGVRAQFVQSRKSFGKAFAGRFQSRESNGRRIFIGVRLTSVAKMWEGGESRSYD